LLRLHPFLQSGSARRLTDLDTPAYLKVAEGLPSVLWDPNHAALSASLRRTPGYPLFLRLVQPWGGRIDVAWIAIAGTFVLTVAIVTLTFVLGRRFGGPRVGVVAAWLVALDVLLIGHTPYVLSDTAFAVAILGLVIVYERLLREQTWRLGLAVGGLYGAATLIRPIALYLAPWLLLGLVVAGGPRAWRRWAGAAAFLVVGATLLVGGWYARNTAVADLPVFSTIEGANIFEYRAAGVVALQRGISVDEARTQLEREYRAQLHGTDAEIDAAKRRIGMQILMSDLGATARITAEGIVPTVIESGSFEMERRLPGPIRRVAAGPLRWYALAMLMFEYLAAIVWLFGFGVTRTKSQIIAILAPVFGYLAVALGPESYARFRVPLHPLLAVLAGVVVVAIVDRRQQSSVGADARVTLPS
jgi:MFS family permease